MFKATTEDGPTPLHKLTDDELLVIARDGTYQRRAMAGTILLNRAQQQANPAAFQVRKHNSSRKEQR